MTAPTRELVVDVPRGWWLTSNQRLNRHRVAERVATLRDLALVEARRQHLDRGLDRVRIVAHLTYPERRRVDPNNAHPTTKALVDGLVDYGLVPDDDHTHVVGPDHRFAGVVPNPRKMYGVRLVVEVLDDDTTPNPSPSTLRVRKVVAHPQPHEGGSAA